MCNLSWFTKALGIVPHRRLVAMPGCRPTLDGTPYLPMPVVSIHVAGVEKMLQQLGLSKSSGPDTIPDRVLQELAPELALVLTTIFQQSLDMGELPEDWGKTNVAPVFKKGEQHVSSHYRPISLTCVCCKLLEHMVCHANKGKLGSEQDPRSITAWFPQSELSCKTQLLSSDATRSHVTGWPEDLNMWWYWTLAKPSTLSLMISCWRGWSITVWSMGRPGNGCSYSWSSGSNAW